MREPKQDTVSKNDSDEYSTCGEYATGTDTSGNLIVVDHGSGRAARVLDGVFTTIGHMGTKDKLFGGVSAGSFGELIVTGRDCKCGAAGYVWKLDGTDTNDVEVKAGLIYTRLLDVGGAVVDAEGTGVYVSGLAERNKNVVVRLPLVDDDEDDNNNENFDDNDDDDDLDDDVNVSKASEKSEKFLSGENSTDVGSLDHLDPLSEGVLFFDAATMENRCHPNGREAVLGGMSLDRNGMLWIAAGPQGVIIIRSSDGKHVGTVCIKNGVLEDNAGGNNKVSIDHVTDVSVGGDGYVYLSTSGGESGDVGGSLLRAEVNVGPAIVPNLVGGLKRN